MVITAPYSKNMDKSICQSKQRAEYKTRYTFTGKYPIISNALDIVGGMFAIAGLLYFIFLLIIIIR